MNQRELIDEIVKSAGKLGVKLAKTNVSLVLDAMHEIVEENAKKGEETKLGWATIEVIDKPARAGRNPRTGEAVTVAAKKVVKVRVLPGVQKAVNL